MDTYIQGYEPCDVAGDGEGDRGKQKQNPVGGALQGRETDEGSGRKEGKKRAQPRACSLYFHVDDSGGGIPDEGGSLGGDLAAKEVDESAAQVHRARAAHCQIIDRSVDR